MACISYVIRQTNWLFFFPPDHHVLVARSSRMGPSLAAPFRLRAGLRDRANDSSALPFSSIINPTWVPIIRPSGRPPRSWTSTPTTTGLCRRIMDSSRPNRPTLTQTGLALQTRTINGSLVVHSTPHSNPRGPIFRSQTPTARLPETSPRFNNSRLDSPSLVPTMQT